MKKGRIIVYIAIAMVVICAIGLGVYYYQKAKQKTSDPFYSIPESYALILRFNNLEETLKEIKKDGSVFKNLGTDSTISSFLLTLDSITFKTINNNQLSAFIRNSPIYYSIHFVGNMEFKSLLTMNINPPFDEEEIINEIINFSEFSQVTKESNDIYSLKWNSTSFYFHFKHGVLSISDHLMLVQEASKRKEMPNKDAISPPIIQKLLKTSSKDATANVLINYRFFYRLISKLSSDVYIDQIAKLGKITDFSALDLSLAENLILLNGYSFNNDSSAGLLKALQTQSPQEITVSKALPEDVCFYTFIAFNNIESLQKELINNGFGLEDDAKISTIKSLLNIDVRNYFYPWMSKEMCFAIRKGPVDALAENALILFKTIDSKEADAKLNELSTIASQSQLIKPDTSTYKGYVIKQIAVDNLLCALFSNTLCPSKKHYYTIYDDFVVFGNSIAALQSYLDLAILGKSLENSNYYTSFISNLNNKASLCLYINPKFASNLCSKYTSPLFAEKLSSQNNLYQNFDGLAIQFVCEPQGNYTNMVMRYQEDNLQLDAYEWQIALDDNISGKIHQLCSPNGEFKCLLVFDQLKNLYQIDYQGKINWKIPMAEFPIGEIQIIDYYANGTYQFLYNSANYVYLIDEKGNRVGNFPKKLSLAATSSISAFTIANATDLKFLIPLEDQKIHCFNKDFKEIKSWAMPILKNRLSGQIQLQKLNGEDIFVMVDETGNVQFFDVLGRMKNQAGTMFTQKKGIIPKVIGIANKQKFMTVDKIGRLIYIDSKGKVEKISLDEFSDNFWFNYADIDNDQQNEFVYFDNNQLKAFNEKSELISNFEIKNAAYLHILKKTSAIGTKFIVITNEGNLIFLNLKGEQVDFQTNKSIQSFFILETTNETEQHLISAFGRVISNFLIK